MENEKIFAMSFGKVSPMLIAKAERKGRTRAEVLEVTAWLTGYSVAQIEELMQTLSPTAISSARHRRLIPTEGSSRAASAV